MSTIVIVFSSHYHEKGIFLPLFAAVTDIEKEMEILSAAEL